MTFSVTLFLFTDTTSGSYSKVVHYSQSPVYRGRGPPLDRTGVTVYVSVLRLYRRRNGPRDRPQKRSFLPVSSGVFVEPPQRRID